VYQGDAPKLSKHTGLVVAFGQAAHGSKELNVKGIVWIALGVK
jgi:hypothetical protein